MNMNNASDWITAEQWGGESLQPLPDAFTHAVVVDGLDGETVITDFMIRRACEQIDDQQQYPFCTLAQPPERRAG